MQLFVNKNIAMSTLLRYFTIANVIVCITVATFLGWFYHKTAINNLIRESEQSNIAHARLLVDTLQPELTALSATQVGYGAGAIPPSQVIESLQQALADKLQHTKILNVKLYSLDGMTLFSTKRKDVGEAQSLASGFQAAKANQIHSELTYRNTNMSSFEGELADHDVLATYLPIQLGTDTSASLMVMEIHSDISEFVSTSLRTERQVILVTGVAFTLMLLGLLVSVGYANRILQRQYGEIKAAEANLFVEKTLLEQGIVERTHALEATNHQLEHELGERKRAQEHLQKSSARLQILREIDQAVLEAKSPALTAQIALRHLCRHILCTRASIVVFDPVNETGEIIAIESDQQVRQLTIGTKVPYSSFSIIQRHRQQENITDLKLEIMPVEPDNQALRSEGICFHVQVPLIYLDTLVGSLNLGTTSELTLDSEGLEVVREVANSLAIAIQQARLNEQVRDHANVMYQQVEELRRAENMLETERVALSIRAEQRTADLRAANAELEKAARLKDEFLAAMSHELRTPLNAILAYAELLQSGIYDPVLGKQKNAVNNIDEAGKHLLALINDVLDVSKITAQTLELQMTRFDVRAMCERSLRLVQQAAEQKNINIVFNLKNQIGMMKADERRITQILTNLLSNAVKFTPAKGQIGLDVEWSIQNQHVRFTVWDTGIGIASDDLPRLFQPFVQLDAGLARNYAGTGLGLALASRLAELHSGEITVESQPNVGSRFTVSLPIALNLQAQFPSKPYQPTNRPVLLVAEDNETNRTMLTDYLDYCGYDTIVAKNGLEALQSVQHQHPDLILMDVQMPVMDGITTIQKLRADGDKTPIIMLTGMTMLGDESRCLSAGADAYLRKPVNLKDLHAMINLKLTA